MLAPSAVLAAAVLAAALSAAAPEPIPAPAPGAPADPAAPLSPVSVPPPPPISVARFVAEGKGALPDGSFRVDLPALRLTVSDLRGPDRAALLASAVGSPTDPFDHRDEEGVPFFATFLLEVENMGAADVVINPSFFTLHVAHDRRWPIGYTQAYTYLRITLDDEALLNRYSALLEETLAVVPAGMRTRRLLVFERFPAKAKKAVLELAGIQTGELGNDIKMSFRRDAKAARKGEERKDQR